MNVKSLKAMLEGILVDWFEHSLEWLKTMSSFERDKFN